MKFFIVCLFICVFVLPANAFAATFDICDAATPSIKKSKWNHKRSKIVSKIGDPRHVAFDTLSPPGTTTTARAKFVYGGISKDLNDETVDVFITTCDSVAHLGSVRTNKDGWIAKKVFLPKAKKSIRYTLHFVVRGDGSSTSSYVWSVPTTQKLVIFDIDGTLTSNDKEIAGDAWRDYTNGSAGDYDAALRKDAIRMTKVATKDALPIYLSGRPYWLMNHTRNWLQKHGVAPGPIVITRRHRDVPPTIEGVGTFKLGVLNDIKKRGYKIESAYGNATTDIHAYVESSIPNDKIFIAGKHGGKRNTVRVGDDWTALIKKMETPKKTAPPR